MIDPAAIYAFAARQKQLLLSAYNSAWARGVHAYQPDADPETEPDVARAEALRGLTGTALLAARRQYRYEPPATPDPVRRAVALAPSFGSLNKMVAELAALAPKQLHETTARLREDYNADQPRDPDGEWSGGGSTNSGERTFPAGTTLYHVSSASNRDSITANGLSTSAGQVWAHDDPAWALAMAGGAGGSGKDVWEVDASGLPQGEDLRSGADRSTVIGTGSVDASRLSLAVPADQSVAAWDNLTPGQKSGTEPVRLHEAEIGGALAVIDAHRSKPATATVPLADYSDQIASATSLPDLSAAASGAIGAATDAFGQALKDWLGSNAYRLDGGDSVAWAGSEAGYAEAADSDGALLAWQDEGDDHVCDSCLGLATMPPQPLSEWPCMPGDGTTICNCGCRCSLDAVGIDVLLGDVYSPALDDSQNALVGQLATAQASALDSMMPDSAYLE